MKAIYNGELIDYSQVSLPGNDRGFAYGDGLFETMAVVRGGVRFLEQHYERVRKGSEILDFDFMPFDQLASHCEKLIANSCIDCDGKMKLHVWRRSGGLYQPEGRKTNYILSFEEVCLMPSAVLESVGFSENMVNCQTAISSLKAISALKYVVAGLEKRDRKLDDILIKDVHGFISEALYSNVFMKKNGVYSTPHISTGCVEGVMRNWFISQLRNEGFEVKEKLIGEDELLQAESVFTTNALGIRHIRKIRDTNYEIDPLAQKLIESIG